MTSRKCLATLPPASVETLGTSAKPLATLPLDQVKTRSHQESAGAATLPLTPEETLMNDKALPLAWVDDIPGGKALVGLAAARAWVAALDSDQPLT